MFEGLKRTYTLASVSGIPIRADLRWLLVIVLLTGISAASIYPLAGNIGGSIVLGAAATLLFFGSVFLHEYAHAVVARSEGLHVVEIVLHPFGGLARFRHPPETPRAEFRIAIAGPAASFLLSLAFVGMIAISTYLETDILTLLLFLLALINFLIAVFNLFPGYPLDGGRVLRAYLWRQGRDLNEATVLTGRAGQMIAVGLIVLGLVFVSVRGEFFTGIWAVMVGFFLLDSATSIIREVNSEENRGIDELMMLPNPVAENTTLQQFVDGVLAMDRRPVFPVTADGDLVGIFALEDLKKVPREEWRKRSVRSVMRLLTSSYIVHTSASTAEVRSLIESNGLSAVAVVDENLKLLGFIYGSNLPKRS